MSDFNYVDSFKQSSQLEYQSKLHDNAVQLQGRRTYIFKLDKQKTDLSVFGEAKDARVYLPHFEQRALYNTNEWTGVVNTNNYSEKEETLSFEYNFARMVYNLRDLKDKIAGELTIINKSEEIFHLVIENNTFLLKSKNAVTLVELKLSDYKSISLFINAAQKACSLISLSYSGDMEEASNIFNINTRLLPNRRLKVNVKDRTYLNCADIIDVGDIILTDSYKLYQVQNAYPSGNYINEYLSWTCKCNTCDIALANLPDDYRKIVTRHQYNLPKTNTRS